jgi:hypothetical protein
MNHSFANLNDAYGDETPTRGRSMSTTSNDTYIIGRSRSPSVLSEVSSPISSLDTDDYDSDRDSVQPHEFRSPERVPEIISQSPLRNIRNPTPTKIKESIHKLQNATDNKEVIKHILRIQKDIQKITRDNDDSGSEGTVPFVEIGLFVSVGLFVLLAMNMMLQMGKQHVTYRFSSYD